MEGARANSNRSQAKNCIKKETAAQVLSCKFCEIFNNTYFIEQVRWLLLQLIPQRIALYFTRITENRKLSAKHSMFKIQYLAYVNIIKKQRVKSFSY